MLEQLRTEIAAVHARDLSVGAAALGPAVLELRELALSLHGAYLRYLEAFDAAGGYEDEHLSSAGWLQAQTNASPGEAKAERRTAQLRRKLPELVAAQDAGRIGPGHLTAAAAGIRDLPEELLPEVDTALATVARLCTARQLAEVLLEVKQSLVPDAGPRDEKQFEARSLSVASGFDGMTEIHGRLTPEVGEKLQAALSAASRPDGEGEKRLPNQRRADALERLLDDVLDAGRLPTERGERPHITLNVDLDTLSADPVARETWNLDPDAREQVATKAARAAASGTSGLPRFGWTGPTSVNSALRLSCDGILLPIFSRGGQPLDAGRRHRLVPAPLRTFIAARDKSCRWPGCGLPPPWCQVHHVRHWARGGGTDRGNLLLLCNRHHSAAHDGRFTVVLQGPGEIAVRRRTSPRDPMYEITSPARQPALTLRTAAADATASRAASLTC